MHATSMTGVQKGEGEGLQVGRAVLFCGSLLGVSEIWRYHVGDPQNKGYMETTI